MKPLTLIFLLLGLVGASLGAATGSPEFEGRWRLDPAASSTLDGWTAMDLALKIDGDEVAIRHDMRWRRTRVSQTNVVNTARPVELADFFRVEARHMAVYPLKDTLTPVTAGWLDGGRTLRVEAVTSVEISQGEALMRIYQEYRVAEGGGTLTLIELRSSRNRPLVYVFRKLAADDTTQP